MRVLLLHEAVPDDAPPESRDTLLQAVTLQRALSELGHRCRVVPVGADLDQLARLLTAQRPDCVFNLVESLAGYDGVAVAVPALLDGIGIRYTGSRSAALGLANDKCLAKAQLRRCGLPTPEWLATTYPDDHFRADDYIVKARFEHASRGIDDSAIAHCRDASAARHHIEERTRRLARPCFAERFIRGREFNLSLLAGHRGIELLAPAEIDFSAFPPGKVQMVGYRAKWAEESFEYHNTPRRFDFPASDAPLLAQLGTLARGAFDALGLGGYARVDIRVDDQGPWILEINANPCLSPDAGFAAALAASGVPYKDAVQRILDAASVDALLTR
jgi:D-alanine-D-alanine ligase